MYRALVMKVGQGAKLRTITWFPFGNPPLKFGFPKLFQAFREAFRKNAITMILLAELSESLALLFTGCPVGNPCKKFGFRQCFWVSRTPGNSVISLPGGNM